MSATSLADDLLEGIDEISAYLGKGPRQGEHMLAIGAMPFAFRIGNMWHARKSAIDRHIAALEAQALALSDPSAKPGDEPAAAPIPAT